MLPFELLVFCLATGIVVSSECLQAAVLLAYLLSFGSKACGINVQGLYVMYRIKFTMLRGRLVHDDITD